MQQRNFLVFLVVAFLLFVGMIQLRQRFWPPPEKEKEAAVKKTPEEKKKPEEKKPAPAPATQVKLPPQPKPTPADKLIALGENSPDSRFHLYLLLDPLGAGVRTIVLNKFQQATEGGLPDDDKLLSLVPPGPNREIPSFLMYHFDPADTKFDHPLDTLGRVVWKVVKKNGKAVVTDTNGDKQRQSVSFTTEVEGVTITKTYSLTEKEYHVALRIDLERPKGGAEGASTGPRLVRFRYQLVGAKGLPVEGKWYTATYRNALFGSQDSDGNFSRDLEELRHISLRGGGDPVAPDGGFLRYAGVAVQYFASVIAVDDDQTDTKFVRRGRATLETALFKGKIKHSDPPVPDNQIVVLGEDGKTTETFFLPPELTGVGAALEDGTSVAVIYRPLVFDEKTKSSYKLVVTLRTGDKVAATHDVWEDDITVRVTTESMDLKPGSKVTHKYLLYNGPVKPSLLGQLKGEKAVPEEVVDRYTDSLLLNTMTDSHSPGWMGRRLNSIGWTWLVIKCTNLMHRVLTWLHWLVPSYGLCIILLTVMVRGMMFPLSRKQALMGMKMQALAPELKKMQAKFKDDKQALGMAQWELYRKHGVSPFGSCWVMMLQMPIFMGLYYALQESIQFRLASFWPTWIANLAAPDMLYRWGDRIPLISQPQYFGQFYYLGPYLNLLPVIAVTLMIAQQKMLMPPPTDEQQEMQQKMMKWMMVFFGLMFYKVAAGLCIYFIASSLWGFAERKLLPKSKLPKLGLEGVDTGSANPASSQPAPVTTNTPPSSGWSAGRKGARNKRKGAAGKPAARAEEPSSKLGRLRRRFSDWWNDLLEQAKKK